MDEYQEPRLTPFDQMINNDKLQLLKATIPYAPLQMQGMLSVFAKIEELQAAVQYSRRPPSMHMMSQESNASLPEMLQDILPYTSGNIRNSFETITSVFSMIDMMKSFQDLSASENYDQEGDNTFERMDE